MSKNKTPAPTTLATIDPNDLSAASGGRRAAAGGSSRRASDDAILDALRDVRSALKDMGANAAANANNNNSSNSMMMMLMSSLLNNNNSQPQVICSGRKGRC